MNNVFNFQDLMYDFAVIEVFTKGIPAIAAERSWYKWNDIDDKWEKIDEPEIAKGTINWAKG